jgi:hypothetical protein
MTSSTEPKFSKSFDAWIWQIKLDYFSNSLALELRSEDQLSVRYAVLNMKDDPFDLNFIEIEATWWSSLLGLYGSFLIINNFPNQSNPGPSDVQIVDWKSGEIIEVFEQVLVDQFDKHMLKGRYMKEDHSTEPFELDLSKYANYGLIDSSMMVPGFIPGDNPDFEVIRSYLNTLSIHPVLGAEYLENEEDILFTTYEKINKHYNRILLWIRNGQVLLKKVIDKNMKGVSLESFVTFEKKLIFVEDRKTLQVYEM